MTRPMTKIVTAAAALLISAGAVAQQPLVLREGTDIRVATLDDLSSKTMREGDSVAMEVVDPVVVDGVTVIPAGTPAVAEISNRRGNGMLGRSGKLEISVREIVADGRSVPVRGDRDAKGTTGAPAVVGAAVVFLPLGIFMKGKEARIKAGTTVDVFVDRDVPVVMAAGAPPAERPIIAPAPGR